MDMDKPTERATQLALLLRLLEAFADRHVVVEIRVGHLMRTMIDLPAAAEDSGLGPAR
jgi:hypothetical protein